MSSSIKVLLVEDSKDDAALAVRVLRRAGFVPQCERVASAAAMQAALSRQSWDAVISDFNMPGFTGRDALEIFRSAGLDVPFILISGAIGEETAAQAMKAGASDYLMKQNLARLGPALERELREAKLRAAHRQAQRDLIESEARFRSLTEMSSDFYWESDAEHRLTRRGSAKPGAVSVFQRGAEIGEQRWEAPYLSPSAAGWQAHREMLDARLPFRDFEFSRLGDDGTEHHISVSGDPVFDTSGAFQGYRGVGTDITERRRADRLLRQIMEGTASATGDEFMRTLTRTLAEALGVRFAFVGEFTGAANERVRVKSLWNGLEHAESFEYALAGTPCQVAAEQAECFCPSGVQARFPQDERLARLGIDCYFGIRLRSSAGEPLGILTVMNTRKLRDDALVRSVLRIFGARAGAEFERLKATSALERGGQRFAKTFRSSPLAVVLTRLADGSVLDVNEAVCQLFGRSQQEMVGRTTIELGFWLEASDRARAVDMLRSSGALRGFEHLIRRKSGETRLVQDWVELIELEGEPCVVGSLLDVTEARRASDALRDSEAQMRLVAENLPAMIVYFDRGCRVRYANRRYTEFYAGGGADVQGWHLRQVVGEQSWTVIADRMARVLSGEPVAYEREAVRADGDRRDVSLNIVPHRAESGEVLGAYGLAFDVTKRKRVERQAQRFSRILEDSLNEIYVFDANSLKFLMVNRGARANLGYTLDELQALTPLDLKPEHAVESFAALVAPLRTGARKQIRFSTLHRRKDRTTYPVDVHVEMFADEAPPVFVAMITDITERKRIEDALRESEARFRDLSELSSDWYWEQDENYRFVDMQDAPTGSSPLRAGGYVGKTRWEAHAECLAPELWAAHRRQVEAHEPFRDLEYARLSSDGQIRWVSVSGMPIVDREGRFKGYRGVGREITERKRAEEALRLRDRALEASVNAIMITDASRQNNPIVYVNPAFERNTGYPASEVLGRNPKFLLGADTDQPGIEALRAALKEQREGSALLRNYRKDGTLFWNELRIAPVRDPVARVTHFVGVQNDVTDRVRYQAELERQANFDSLTGLANRNLLSDRLRQSIVRVERSGRVGAVLFLDLDRFKVINDSLGHAMGDRVLTQIGWRLSEAVRGGDTVARMGGDEFVVVLADLAREEDAAIVAQKLLGVVASPLSIEGHDFLISTSIGVAVFTRDGTDPETLLKHADIALYRGKERGRGCVAFFAQEMNDRAVNYFNLDRDLRSALERGEFVLHFQPIIEMASGEIEGAEALLRWRKESGKMVSPLDFIPIAEESGLIVPIGAWVLRSAVATARLWNSDGRRDLSVAVNVSARQFRDPGLVAMVRDALAESGLDPRLLNIEITESTVMHGVEDSIATLHALRGIGVSLSVDDFGTGYSSLSYLKRLPLDHLKVDRSFVKDVPGDRDNVAITRAVIELAHSLELEVVAEGVETDEQRRYLLAQGCDFAQGYLFSKPVEADTFAKLIAVPRAVARDRPPRQGRR